MSNVAKYIPLNPVEHESMIRTIIGAHMEVNDGNPSTWVVKAVTEAFQRGFGVGFDTGLKAASSPPPPPPAFKVAFDRAPEPARPSAPQRYLGRDPSVIDV